MKDRIQSLTIKHWRKLFLVLCAIGMIVVGVIIGMDSLKKKEVSAHPTNAITLDEGGSNEFEVPVDGQENLEYSNSYNKYKQTDTNIPSLGKQLSETETAKTKLFSSQIQNYISKSYVTSNGNIISQHIYSSYPTGTGFNIIDQTRIILESKTGEILDTKWVHETPNSITQPSGNKATWSNSFFQKSGTEYVALYSTNLGAINSTTFIDEGNHLSISILDNNRTLDLSGINLKDQIIHSSVSTNTGTFLSRPAIYPHSQEKVNYINIEHLDGQVLDVIEFEASPEVQTHVPEGSNPTENIAFQEDMHYIDDYTVIGIERMISAGKTTSWLCKWTINPNTNKATRTEIESYPNSFAVIAQDICSNNKVFFQVYRNGAVGESQVELLEIEVNTSTMRLVKNFPKETRLNFLRQGSGYLFIGQIQQIEGEFENIGVSSGIYTGFMNSDFDWKSSSSIQLNFPEASSAIEISSVTGSEDMIILSGKFPTREIHFIDEVVYGNFPGELTSGVNKEWSPQIYSPGKGNAFVSILKKTDDWSPLIKAPDPFNVNIDDPDLSNQNIVDRWLLTGSKTGSFTDTKAVKVYDTTDIDKGLFIYGIDWLRERINKNPNSLVYENDNITLKSSDPIDWQALGFDKNKTGPQLVTYFVTDSQKQTSTTSAYINNLTNETVTDEEDEYALDAKNFHVPLNGVGTTISDANKFKEFAETMAWNLTDQGSAVGDQGNGIDEDGTDSSKLSSKVTVDADQLKALREAKVAKPYPVDVTYKPKLGVEIVNRVWVFLTTKNTVPNSETNPAMTPQDTNGVVYYSDDYELPFRMRGSHTANDVLARGNIRVYDYYDADHENSAELPTLADASKNANKLVVENLSVINNATEPGKVTPSIRYEWDGTIDANHKDGSIAGNETRGYLDVTLTGNILLHVRQVVLDASDEIAVPKKGYVEINNRLSNGGLPTLDTNYQAQLVVGSGKLADHPSFTDIGLSVEHLPDNADEVLFSTVIPEFYEYVGYYSTTEQADSQGASHQGQTNYVSGDLALLKSTLNNEEEFWITLYLKPTEDDQDEAKAPQPYSWDYKKNDLGKIKTN